MPEAAALRNEIFTGWANMVCKGIDLIHRYSHFSPRFIEAGCSRLAFLLPEVYLNHLKDLEESQYKYLGGL